MRLPRWLLWLFPSLAPRGTWADAVLVTDPQRLAALDAIYAETVAWVRARRPDAVIAPVRDVALRVWPKDVRSPKGFEGLDGRVLVAGVCSPDDTRGTMVLREAQVDRVVLIAHESKHCITGESGHPDWLFPK